MIEPVMELLGYDFVWRGLLTGCCVAVICSMLGVLLVLRRLSLIGDGLAHVTFFGVAAGLWLRAAPVFVALPVVMASSLGIMRLAKRARLYGDAAIGMVSAAGVAGGVLLASLGGGFNVDIFGYLFGNILAITPSEMYLAMALSVAVASTLLYYHRQLLSVSFDEEFAAVSGVNTGYINTLLVLMVSVAVVLTIKVVGVLLTSALVIVPAVTAIQLGRGFRATMLIAAVIAVLSVLAGMALSLALNLPSGAAIVLVSIAFFFFSFPLKRFGAPL